MSAQQPADGAPIPDAVSARTEQVLAAIPDTAFAERLRRIMVAAAKAIAGLREIELGKYEDASVDGAPDLSMWEAVAPVIRDTVMDVNSLLSSIRESFHAPVPGGIAAMIGQAIEEAGVGEAPQGDFRRRMDDATLHIQTLSSVLATEITNLGERMRSPQVVSDRWNLLSDLQYFRGKFRAVIGDMVFLALSSFQPVNREEVIPEYTQDVRQAIDLRKGVTDLARLVSAYHQKIGSSPQEKVTPLLEDLAKNLDAFGRSKAYVTLRAQDKRRVVEFRYSLKRIAGEMTPTPSTAAAMIAEFSHFVQGLSLVNKRECLVEHDREVLAASSVDLENAELVREKDSKKAVAALAGAVKRCQDVYGKDPGLDAYLRKARKRDLATLAPHEVAGEIEQLRGLIVTAMMS